MKAVLLADALFAVREHSMLRRIEIGLADEGVRVIRALPESAASSVICDDQLCAPTVIVPDRVLPGTDRLRANVVAHTLLTSPDGDAEPPPDIVHAFGGDAWGVALGLCRATGARLVAEVWRRGLAERAAALPILEQGPPLLIAPDPAISRAIFAERAGALVATIPWGTHASDDKPEILPDGRTAGIMIVTTGREPSRLAECLHALAALAAEGREFLAFLDARSAHRAHLWALADRLNLLSRLSLIDELEDRRDLLLCGDIVISPDVDGEQRSVLLDAMAHGLAVVAAPDPSLSFLRHGESALVLTQRDVGAWTNTLRSILADPDSGRALGRSARAFVRATRPASQQIRGLLDAYASLAPRDRLPLRAGPAER